MAQSHLPSASLVITRGPMTGWVWCPAWWPEPGRCLRIADHRHPHVRAGDRKSLMLATRRAGEKVRLRDLHADQGERVRVGSRR